MQLRLGDDGGYKGSEVKRFLTARNMAVSEVMCFVDLVIRRALQISPRGLSAALGVHI